MMREIALVIVGLSLGMWFGYSMEARKWRRNADQIQRIENKGRLYKVTRA
jgi:hypothetical protein